MRDTDNDRLYSFELTEQLLSGSQVEAWKEIAAKTLAEGGDEADMKPLHPLEGNSSREWNMEEMKATLNRNCFSCDSTRNIAFSLFTILCCSKELSAQNEHVCDP